ncbi:hypothetical protein [Daejeonella sp.]|uniref:hypothetical protein n=1 Tax=Daejeonella sp. TaxID=2805397 RepID=UPI0030BD1D8D
MATEIKNRPNVPGTEAKKDSAKATEVKANGAVLTPKSTSKPEEKKSETPNNATNQPEQKPAGMASSQSEKPAEQLKTETTTSEEGKAVRPVLNLESTLKVVQDLHRRSIQRDNLLTRIGQLEAFEISLIEGSDELESNYFQGCKLTITDDKGKQFTTNTAGLIRMVSQFIYEACIEKLQDIEANIVFPNS